MTAFNRNPNCRDCGLWESSENVCIPGDGSVKADIVIIGEAPGAHEARTGKPFMGQSGEILRNELAKVGLKNVYITNVNKCRPPENRTPTPAEMKACRKYLDEELSTIKPRFVVTLGATASKAMKSGAKITEVHGKLIEGEHFTIAPMFHPAYALRDPSKLPAFQQDMARLARAYRGEERTATVNWAIVTRGNFRKFIKEFIEAPEFSFDIETSGLFPYDGKGKVRCIAFGLPNRSWLLPLQGVDLPIHRDMKNDFRGRYQAQKRILKLLADLAIGKTICGQNAKFDNHWLFMYYGVRFRLNFDVMLAHHVLDENTEHGLKELVRSHLDEPDYDLTSKEKKGQSQESKLFEYCAKDAAYTLRLKRIFDAQFKKDRILRRLFYKLVMPAARAIEDIEMVGLTIDMPGMAKVESETRAAHAEALAELNRMVGKVINWNSPPQIAKLLFTDLGLTPTVLTAKGAPSTGEEALLDIRDQHPVAEQLVRYRELEKFLSTYIEGWKEYMVGDRLFMSYKIHGTVTGRYSSRLHQVPRDGRIRNLVTAPPGWKFLQADISQAEMRTAAILSGDLELIKCFREGIDAHWRTLLHTIGSGGVGEYVEPVKETALKLSKHLGTGVSLSEALEVMLEAGHEAAIAVDKRWKEGRKKAKAINFGFLFGMYEKKFIETCKLKYGFEPTFEEAKRFRAAYFALYRGLTPWHDKQKKLVHLNGYVRNLAGRLRRLPGIYSSDKMLRMECERQAINSPVQGFIGDYKAMCLVEIHETIPHDKFKLVGEHHDALLGIVREDAIDEVCPRIQRIMCGPKLLEDFKIELTVPMEAEIELGPWGGGTAWKPK